MRLFAKLGCINAAGQRKCRSGGGRAKPEATTAQKYCFCGGPGHLSLPGWVAGSGVQREHLKLHQLHSLLVSQQKVQCKSFHTCTFNSLHAARKGEGGWRVCYTPATISTACQHTCCGGNAAAAQATAHKICLPFSSSTEWSQTTTASGLELCSPHR